MNADEQTSLNQALDALREEVAKLSERVAALEALPAASGRQFSGAPTSAVGKSRVVDETLLAVITAALAAYLGIEPRIRQIRLLGGASWAQQGRVTIQASHALPVRHG